MLSPVSRLGSIDPTITLSGPGVTRGFRGDRAQLLL
jgi:hypothetical protein